MNSDMSSYKNNNEWISYVNKFVKYIQYTLRTYVWQINTKCKLHVHIQLNIAVFR